MPAYADNAETALRLISEAGRVMPMSRTPIGANYDPVAGEDVAPVADPQVWNIDAVTLPATIARFRGIDNKIVEDKNLILTKARYLLVAAKSKDGTYIPEPIPEDRVVFDSKTWRVLGCSPLKPADIPILYQVGVILES